MTRAILTFLIIACSITQNAQAAAAATGKYLELVFVEEPGASNGSGSGPRDSASIAKLLQDPANKVTPMASVGLKDGPILLKGSSPAGIDVTVTGEWDVSQKAPQKIGYRVAETVQTASSAISHMWSTTDNLSVEKPLCIFEPWTSTSHLTIVIRIVDHPLTK